MSVHAQIHIMSQTLGSLSPGASVRPYLCSYKSGGTWGRAEDKADFHLAQGGEGGALALRRPQQGGQRSRA